LPQYGERRICRVDFCFGGNHARSLRLSFLAFAPVLPVAARFFILVRFFAARLV
jgi:hypothetical protein